MRRPLRDLAAPRTTRPRRVVFAASMALAASAAAGGARAQVSPLSDAPAPATQVSPPVSAAPPATPAPVSAPPASSSPVSTALPATPAPMAASANAAPEGAGGGAPAGAPRDPGATAWTLPAGVTISGFVQGDWAIVNQTSQDEVNAATGDPLNERRFTLRRGHVRAAIDRGLVLGALEIDANTVRGPQVRPIDAEASIRWPPKADDGSRGLPFAMATIGLFKTPFGFEVLEADNKRPFLERSAVLRALFPGEFDLGLRLQGGYRFLNYALGIMNGDPIGERAFPGRDPNQSKDLVFRVGVDTEVMPKVRFEAGVSGVTGSGFHKGTPSTKDTLVWRDVNEDGVVQPTEIQVIPGTSATPSQNYHRFALGADARLHVALPRLGELVLRGEIVRATNLDRGLFPADPVSAGRDLREIGWTAGATQEITRYGIVGVRYDRYQPDADASQQLGAHLVPVDMSVSTWALLGGLRYDGARLLLEYDRNTNAQGRTSSGAPTTLAADVLTLRGEMSF